MTKSRPLFSIYLCCALQFNFGYGLSGQMSSMELLEKSIRYHDPDGILEKSGMELLLKETRPNGPDRETQVYMNPSKEQFILRRTNEDGTMELSRNKKAKEIVWNGTSDIPQELKIKYRLDADRLDFWNNYYRYLWFLPRTLRDPGTIMEPLAAMSQFDDRICYRIAVRYEEVVGSDSWYFYFDRENFSLIGYRFYHDESKNDGEYIVLEKEAVDKNLRLPSRRNWYTNANHEYLGSDEILRMRIK